MVSTLLETEVRVRRLNILVSSVLKNTLVTGVASLEGELDALVLTEVGRGLGSDGIRHCEYGGFVCV
jgi:hypothetical protein